MRQFIALLLSLSLSWITTGYACNYATSHATQSMCCCHQAQAKQCPSPKYGEAGSHLSSKACCDIVSLNGIQADEKALASSSFDHFQPLAPPSASLEHSLLLDGRSSDLFLTLVDNSPPGWGTQTYFQTARLRI
jgi:hypothetical protein